MTYGLAGDRAGTHRLQAIEDGIDAFVLEPLGHDGDAKRGQIVRSGGHHELRIGGRTHARAGNLSRRMLSTKLEPIS